MQDYQGASADFLVNRLKSALFEKDGACDERVRLLEAELAEARAEIQRILNHSHQVQDCLEQAFHDDQDKRRQIDEISQQLSELQSEQYEAGPHRVEALELELFTIRQHLSEKSVELEVVLGELERYFIQNRQLRIMVDKYEKLQDRSVALLQSCCNG